MIKNQDNSQLKSTNRVINSENEKKPVSEPKNKLNWKIILLIIIGCIILIVGVVIMTKLLMRKKPKKSNLEPIDNEPGYIFQTKKYELKRFSINENKTQNIMTNETYPNLIINRRTIYDFIVISEEEASEENKFLYNKTFLAAIAIAGECFSIKNEICEPQRLVDLINQNNSNLRTLEEIEDLKDFPINLCLLNLTDNNIILSMKCPKALSEVKLNTILSDMKLFKPTTLKRTNKEKRNITITQIPDGENTIISEIIGGSCDYSKKLNSLCTNVMNITKDPKNNIISLIEENVAKTVNNKNNSFLNNRITKLIDITNKTKYLDSNNYLSILDKILPKLEKYMELKEYISKDELIEIYNENKNKDKNNIINRNLLEVNNDLFISENLLSLNKFQLFELFDIKVNLLNKLPIREPLMEARSELIIDNYNYEISSLTNNVYIGMILDKIFRLNIASKYLVEELYSEIRENLNNINDIINKNLTSLKDSILYKDLEEILNLTLSYNKFEILPFDIIFESNNLKNKLDLIFNGIKKGNLKDRIQLLNFDIYDFINKTELARNLIYKNLKELERLLNSPKSKITEIATYYLNNTSSAYNNIIEETKNTFNLYYKNEYDRIISKIDLLLNNFKKNISNDLKNYTNLINNLVLQIENRNITVENATEKDCKNITTNFGNSINLINEIIGKIKYKLKNGITFKDSGFFISNNSIDDYRNLYNQLINDLYSITEKLDNDEYIDKKFNEVMINFKNNINYTINYIYQILDEKLLKKSKNVEDIFISKKNKISNDINYLGIDISNKIKKEYNYYLSQVKKNLNLFLRENKDNLNQIILDLNTIFSEEALEEISELYDKAFKSSLDNIKLNLQQNKLLINNYINNLSDGMENNTKLLEILNSLDEGSLMSIEGFENILASKSITKGSLNKKEQFKSNLKYSNDYIDQQLFIDLLSIYQNTTMKLKELLQSIKNNKIIEEYPDLTELNFINNNVKIKNNLNKRLNKIISNNIFNSKYLTELNNYKESQIKEIENINKHLENKEYILNNLNVSIDINNDFCINFYEKKTYSGISSNLYTDSISKEYCYPLSINSDNNKKLIPLSIYNDENILNYLNKFNEFYLLLRNKTNEYNNKINELKNILSPLENKTVEKNITFDYLSEIQEYISSLMEEYSKEVIIYYYTFYQNDSEIITKYIFKEFLTKFETNFDLFKEDVINNKNLDNFKYSIYDFYIFGSIYENIISQNISKDIYDIIICHQKNIFNNDISSFYNNIIKLINSTYQYIINNIPNNQIGFNNILNQRKNEINNVFDELIKKINKSKNTALDIKEQISSLQIEEEDFFKIKSILIQISEETSNSLKNKILEIGNIVEEDENNDELSFVSNLYLQDSENGKLINNYFEIMKNDEFIFLNYSELIKIINENWVYKQVDFINNLNSELKHSDKEISNEFSNEKENYIIKLGNIITKYLPKEEIINKINNLYQKKFKELNNEEINLIKEYFNDIIKKIKNNLSNEAIRLKTTAVSYNNDYTKINNTIKEYKELIFNKLNNSLFSEFDEFHQNMINEIYINYIEKYLNECIKETKKFTINLKSYQTLNSTYNIGEIIDSIVEDIIVEYKNDIKIKIDNKYKVYIKKLNNMIIEIEDEYNSNLFNILKKIAIDSKEDSEYPPYDFDNIIKNGINNEIDTKINNIKNIIIIDNNNTNSINIKEWEKIDFSKISSNLSEIYNSFEEFITFQILYEKNQIKTSIKNYIISNFNSSLNNILSTTGKDFFKIMIQYNENLKLKGLFDKIKNSLLQSLNYYIALYENSKIKALPKDLKIKIFELNNIDKIINNSKQQISKIIKSKVDKLIEKVKHFITKKYVLFYKEDVTIEMNYNKLINEIIDDNLNELIPDIEDNCHDLLSFYINKNFEEIYKKVFNYKAYKTLEIINKQKELFKIKLDNLFTLDSDKILNQINQKIANITDLIKEYNNLIENFKLSDELMSYLNNYANDNIIPCFKGLNNILSESINKQVELMDNNYNNSLNFDIFRNTYLSIKEKYFENIKRSINSYGTSDYEQNLDKKMDSLRTLSENDNQKRNGVITDKIFNELFDKLEQTELFIRTFQNSNEFENLLSNNINKLNLSYKKMKYNINNNNYLDYLVPILDNKMLTIKNMTLYYYNSINITYYKIKNYFKFKQLMKLKIY